MVEHEVAAEAATNAGEIFLPSHAGRHFANRLPSAGSGIVYLVIANPASPGVAIQLDD